MLTKHRLFQIAFGISVCDQQGALYLVQCIRMWYDDVFNETFSRNWPLVQEIPLTKASDAELWCFLWPAPEQTVTQTIETPVIWDAIVLIIKSL